MDRLLRPSWPPIAALVAGAATFVAVLLLTPPGLLTPLDLLLRSEQDPMALSAAYTAGAASSLAIGVMLILAPVLALLDLAWRTTTRTNGRPRPDRRTPSGPTLGAPDRV